MTLPIQAVDAEDVALQWFLGTETAELVTWGGKIHVYQAMPTGSPKPSVILYLAGNDEESRSDLSEDHARITFECWGKSRVQAKELSKSLRSEIKSLAFTGPVDTSAGQLSAAQISTSFWLPDSESNAARYIVETYITVI